MPLRLIIKIYEMSGIFDVLEDTIKEAIDFYCSKKVWYLSTTVIITLFSSSPFLLQVHEILDVSI